MECQRCGLCCRKLIIEIGCHDIVREPRLASVARPFLDVQGPCGFTAGGDNDGEAVHDGPCNALATGGTCPMLSAAGLCSIYPTRPNTCVGFPAGGQQCLDLRRQYLKEPGAERLLDDGLGLDEIDDQYDG
jgi:Fe-S-cluster containining protein